jgi:hypothetical protein
MCAGKNKYGYPTGEYRLQLYPNAHDELVPDNEYGCYIYALGSRSPPRHIGWPDTKAEINAIVSVLLHGGLHWHIEQYESHKNMIMVFDTMAESFRQLRASAVPDAADLFEIAEMLGMASFNDKVTTIYR